MNRDEIVLVWLDYQGTGFSKFEQIIDNFENFDDVFSFERVKNANFDNDIKSLLFKLQKVDLKEFEKTILDEFAEYDIVAVTFFSKEYPGTLKNISDPPLVLYAKGDVSLLSQKSISIVGTRKPTTYGRIVCENFTKELTAAGLITVSGLAYGIDTLVAEKTIIHGGKTIAVLAGGLDSIYPAQNTALAAKIVSTGGLIISEYRVGVKPANYHFISRNRIVSALGLGVLIVEAGKHSGTMTTANFALEQSRELFVIPGNLTSPQSEGTNMLIDQMPEVFTISPNRILFKLGIKRQTAVKSAKQIDLIENKILELLSHEKMSFDCLCERLSISASELSSKLIKMEMFGLVKKGEGNFYYKM